MKNLKNNLLLYLKNIKEPAMLVGTILLFFIAPTVIRLIDSTAGEFNSGILQNAAVTICFFAIYQLVVWSINKNLWKAPAEYLRSGMFNQEFFTKITPIQRICVTLFIYFSLFLLIVLLNRSLFEMK